MYHFDFRFWANADKLNNPEIGVECAAWLCAQRYLLLLGNRVLNNKQGNTTKVSSSNSKVIVFFTFLTVQLRYCVHFYWIYYLWAVICGSPAGWTRQTRLQNKRFYCLRLPKINTCLAILSKGQVTCINFSKESRKETDNILKILTPTKAHHSIFSNSGHWIQPIACLSLNVSKLLNSLTEGCGSLGYISTIQGKTEAVTASKTNKDSRQNNHPVVVQILRLRWGRATDITTPGASPSVMGRPWALMMNIWDPFWQGLIRFCRRARWEKPLKQRVIQ